MTVQYCSDLHLEFEENKAFMKTNPLSPKGDVLLLAGDVVPFALIDKHAGFFDFVSDHFETTYWVPGNHEYYRSDLADKFTALHEKIRSNVFLVNNYTARHQHVKFIFSTLWSTISPVYEWDIQRGMADFRLIQYEGQGFTPFHVNQLHQQCKDFIFSALDQTEAEKTVVVTHHVPTLMRYPEKFKGSILNEAFATELYDLIEPSPIHYWLYGHHHENTPDFEIGKVKLITNQLGYIKYKEHYSFKPDKVVEL